MKNPSKNNSSQQAKGRFGTFTGVFTPTVLTILGIILFLRIGWVVGQSGLVGAIAIILFANAISFLTGLSLSSIATNMNVKTGGAYYMISRTLGLEIGGAIGIPLYFSQAISVAFYIIGFSEAFNALFPAVPARLLSTVLVLTFGYLAYVGADFALKIQLFILAIMAAALASFFASGWESHITVKLFSSSSTTVSFWKVFAIFFPAVTGIMAGVSMSGDLKDSTRSIPWGTMSAIIITSLIYLAVAVWLGTHATTEQLLSDNMIIQKMARWPLFIILGVWTSTLSSALGSVLAAPRTLQAVALDGIVPRVFGHQLGSGTEPRLAVIVTTAFAVTVVWMGELNFVATIITMFFLNTYGMLNLTAGIERIVGNPSFRPRFRFPGIVSLIGAAGCYGAMFLINAKATVIAIILSYGIFILLEQRSLRQDWGDIRHGIWFAIARLGLLRLESEPYNVRNWRPNVVVFSGIPHSREQLLDAGTWFVSARGLTTFYHLLQGDFDELVARGLREASRKHLHKYLAEQNVTAFAESTIVNDFYQGVLDILQAHGIAGLEPNTALMGWSSQAEGQWAQLNLMRRAVALKKSLLFLNYDSQLGFGKKRKIDVWWGGKDRNAELMLLLAHIICQSPPWTGAKIRVLRMIKNEEGRKGAEAHITELLKAVRVKAKPVILVPPEPETTFNSILGETSMESDLVFLGMRLPSVEEIGEYARYIDTLLESLPSTFLVRSAETVDILSTEPSP